MNRQIKVFLGEMKKRIGTLFFNAAGMRENSGFEYNSEWVDSPESFEIDPELPLKAGRVFRSKKEDGSTFHGAIADSEPDGWGRQVIMRTFAKSRKESRGQGVLFNSPALSSLDFLLSVDDFSRIGALRFQDENGVFQRTAETGKGKAPPLIELSSLLHSSRAVETDTATMADLDYLRGKGTSLGGLRPKCTIIDQDGALSIGKFPSVRDSYAVTKGEVLALHLAEASGIYAAKGHIVESEGTPVALIKRFDRTSSGERIPYVSAATLLGINDSREIHTYTEIVAALKRYSADYKSDVEELWRRIAFFILITNVDDHMRNLGFLHVEKGLWRLSPAFDINPFPDRQRVLKTWISEETGDAASMEALIKSISLFGIDSKRAYDILARVEDAVSHWRSLGKKIGLTSQELNAFEDAFEHEERLFLQRYLRHRTGQNKT